jgi:uncharacterized protein YciI
VGDAMSDSPHHLLLYEYVADMAQRRGPHRSAHLDRIKAGRDAGQIVLAGALGDPPSGGAIVFRGLDREAIEAFVADDPYMRAGLITTWRVEPWTLV